MTTRNLSILVLSLVLGTVMVVGWYLEGERPIPAATQPTEQRAEHVWRTHPGTTSAHHSRRQRGIANAGLANGLQGVAAPATQPALAGWLISTRSGRDPLVCDTPGTAVQN